MNTSDDVGGTDAGKEALVEQMGDLIQGMYAQCRSESPEEWTELELTMPQLHTMALLSQGPQRMGVIAGRLSSRPGFGSGKTASSSFSWSAWSTPSSSLYSTVSLILWSKTCSGAGATEQESGTAKPRYRFLESVPPLVPSG